MESNRTPCECYMPVNLPDCQQSSQQIKLEGTWKGTSLCQQKQSACHDENVVYHISKKAANIYTMQASKIVNGAKQNMGTFDSDSR